MSLHLWASFQFTHQMLRGGQAERRVAGGGCQGQPCESLSFLGAAAAGSSIVEIYFSEKLR